MTGKNPTTIPRRQLGRQLREMRQGAGLSIADAARLIERGAGTLQRLEKGENPRIRLLDIEALCRLYDASEEKLEVLKALAREGDERARPTDERVWWHRYDDLIPSDFETYMSLEAAAAQVIMYQPDVVPGIVQTAEYARALERVFFSSDSPMELEQRIQVRMQRQTAITRRLAPVEVDLLIDEAVIRRVAGARQVMAAQLRKLADTPTNVRVRVVPFSVGFPLGCAPGPFVILRFPMDSGTKTPVEPTTVYVESYGSRLYYDRTDIVDRYVGAHEQLGAVALSEADSKHLLRQVAKEFEA
ncbi:MULTISPECIES: helix-turn-helix transcriptional regulator [unclassified Nocardia]|uniref:helix-turn-helix domain-containing protein n=1 Tax=unclassified Nocardia TaxID=2637762 RepID=UPI00278BFF4B|nr:MULTISPECIES: helix-turn-helix transcriptional regulator [unclassified Nocardia]